MDIADGAMLATVGVWAGNNVIAKAALREIEPLPYALGRVAIVVVLLFAWLGIRRVDLRVRRVDLPLLALAGFTGFGAYGLLFIVGLGRTSAFSAALLISLGPLFTLLFASLLGIETVRRGQWTGVAVAAAGVALFVGDKLLANRPAVGDALTLLAAVTFAVYSLATKPLVGRYGPTVVSAWSSLAGGIGILPATLSASLHHDWGSVSGRGWAALLYSSALSMLAAYVAWAWAIERRGVGRTVPYLYLVPIATGFLAAIFLGERFGLLKTVGALLVLAGVALARGWGGDMGRRWGARGHQIPSSKPVR